MTFVRVQGPPLGAEVRAVKCVDGFGTQVSLWL